MRPRDAPHVQLRIVRNGGADADDNGINQGTQPMQMYQPGRPVDEFRMARCGRDPAVKRLADLCYNQQIVDSPLPQRTEQVPPTLPQCWCARTGYLRGSLPRDRT